MQEEDFNDLRPSFGQVPYEDIINRMENGNESLAEFLRILVSTLDNTQKNVAWSAGISRTRLYEFEVLHSSTEKSLGFFKNFYLFITKDQTKYYRDLADTIIKDVEEVKSNRAISYKKQRVLVQNAIKDVDSATDALDKAKSNHAKACQDVNIAKERLEVLKHAAIDFLKLQEEKRMKEEMHKGKFTMGRMLSAFETTPEQERDKQKRKLDKKESTLMACANDIQVRKRFLREKIYVRDIVIDVAIAVFQSLERERIDSLKLALKRICDLERESITLRTKLLDDLEQAVDAQNAELDLQRYIKIEKKTELTHKYSKALELLDWDFGRRKDGVSGIERDSIAMARRIIARRRSSKASSTSTSGPQQTDTATLDNDLNDDSIISTMTNKNLAIAGQSVPEYDLDCGSSEISDGPRSHTSSYDVHHDIHEESLISAGTEQYGPDHLYEKKNSNVIMASITAAAMASSSSSGIDSTNIEEMETAGMRDAVFLTRSSDDEASIEAAVQKLHDELKGLDDAIEELFSQTDSNSSAIRSSLEEEKLWRNLLVGFEARKLFMQELDNRRGTNSNLTTAGYRHMKNAMKAILDICNASQDYNTVLRVVNMANTFHSVNEKESLTQRSLNIQHHDSDPMDEAAGKMYLIHEPDIRDHPLWKGQGFWESALIEKASLELAFSPPVQWDELNPELLREAVLGVHNVIFGQIVTIAFTMRELGRSFSEVEKTVIDMSRNAHLSEDQEHELVKNIRKTFKNSNKNTCTGNLSIGIDFGNSSVSTAEAINTNRKLDIDQITL